LSHHLNKAAQVAVIVVAAVVMAACSSAAPGESAALAPAWSPPGWLHGTWRTAASALGSGTLTASRHNVEIDIQVSGVSSSYDFAQVEEDGVAMIEYEVGVEDDGTRFYFIAFNAADGSATGFTLYRLSADELEGYVFTWPAGGVRTDHGPFYLSRR